jgi:serine/threonine-protein phosphatase PGAM5
MSGAAARLWWTRAGRAAATAATALAAGAWVTHDRRPQPLLAQDQRHRPPGWPHSSGGAPNFSTSPDPQGLRLSRSRWESNWDAREPAEEDEGTPVPRATRHLLLVRHGHYDLSGTTDEERKLTELGRRQAEATGQRLAELGLPYTRLVRSNMKRAMETAELIAANLRVSKVEAPDPILREGAPTRPEPDAGGWKPEADYFVDGCRVEAAFRKYFHRAEPDQKEDSYEVVVCHANIIRYFLCRVLQVCD